MFRQVIREALADPWQTAADALVLVFTVAVLLAGTVVLWAVMQP